MNIDFPLHFDGRGRSSLASDEHHVREMLEQLIFTSPGERVNRPDLGSGLLQLVFAPNSDELAATAQFTLRAAIQRWLGDVIEVSALDVRAIDASLVVEVGYVIRRTGATQTAVFQRST